MKRHTGMKVMPPLLFGFVLLAAACGGKQSIASKSAVAYDEAKTKGVAIGGGHEHGEHATTSETTTDPSAHPAAASDAHAAMQHGDTADQNAHAGMTMTGTTAGRTTMDHAAMGHGAHGAGSTQNAEAPHGAMTGHAGHGTTTPASGHDMHAGVHGTTSSATSGADPHAGHAQQSAGPSEHAQHGAMQSGATSPAMTQHAGHGAPAAAPPPASRTNGEMLNLQPGATLQPDAFDAPAPISVSEAAKAAQGGSHDMHGAAPAPDTTQSATAPYACPTHPEVTSDTPGTCPKCGMRLVKRK